MYYIYLRINYLYSIKTSNSTHTKQTICKRRAFLPLLNNRRFSASFVAVEVFWKVPDCFLYIPILFARSALVRAYACKRSVCKFSLRCGSGKATKNPELHFATRGVLWVSYGYIYKKPRVIARGGGKLNASLSGARILHITLIKTPCLIQPRPYLPRLPLRLRVRSARYKVGV